MSNFTFLSRAQLIDGDVEILRKRGVTANITDFAILRGGYASDEILGEKNGIYWTRTADSEGNVYVVDEGGWPRWHNVTTRADGARPVLPFSSLNLIPKNQENGEPKRATDGVIEVEYGYYPQNAVSEFMQEVLEDAYKTNKLTKTGYSYTSDSRKESDTQMFLPEKHQVYELYGHRYVRIEAKFYSENEGGDRVRLSNGEFYRNGDYVWVEVSPVKWLVDEKEKIMLAEKILFAGVQYRNIGNYNIGGFITTDIKKFMNEYFAKELIKGGKGLFELGSAGTRLQPNDAGTQLQQNDSSKQPQKSKVPRIAGSYEFDFSEVSEEDIIKGAIQANVSVFLHGKPGCGKSARVRQLDPDFIELNLSHLDPELLDGLAGERDGKAVHIKPQWLEELEKKCEEEPDRLHILFLEELTNATPMMQAKAFGIALDKKVAGRWKLPENTRVVAAGNELDDSLVAYEMAEPLYDRFAHVNIDTTVESWLQWAKTPRSSYESLRYNKKDNSRPKIHPAIHAYITIRGDKALRTPYNREKPQPHADPRRWQMASDMLYATQNPNTLRAILGKELTHDFMTFCKIPTLSIEDVLQGNYTQKDIDSMDLGTKLATVAGLVTVDSENMPAIREFTKKLGPEICRNFEIQWTHGDEDRLEQLQEIMMQEREMAKHGKNEARGTARDGMLHFTIIDREYQATKDNDLDQGIW